MTDIEQLLAVLPPNFGSTGRAYDSLVRFSELVVRWNPTINIVAKSTIGDLWNRHIIDSAQVFRFADQETRTWLDIGSGGGFPGIVCAILAQDTLPNLRMILVEADQRKVVFLRQVVRLLDLGMVEVMCERAERMVPAHVDVVSARALAPLAELCELADRHLAANGIAVLLKGRQSEDEIEMASQSWQFAVERYTSMTSAESSVLVLKGLRHV